MFAGTNATVSGVYCELLEPLIDTGWLCMPTQLPRDALCALEQLCKCVPPGHDSQSRLYVQMMTVMTGHCTHLAHVPSSAQVTAAGASWHSFWALMAVFYNAAQTMMSGAKVQQTAMLRHLDRSAPSAIPPMCSMLTCFKADFHCAAGSPEGPPGTETAYTEAMDYNLYSIAGGSLCKLSRTASTGHLAKNRGP